MAFFRFSAIKRRFDLLVDLNPLFQTFINAHLAMLLSWRRDSSALGAKQNTLPNVHVISLQYAKE